MHSCSGSRSRFLRAVCAALLCGALLAASSPRAAAPAPSLGELGQRLVGALGGLRARALERWPALLEALRSPDPRQRAAAAEALGVLGPAAEPAFVELLEALLRDPSRDVRRTAATALARIAPSHEARRRGFSEALRSADPEVRRTAAETLARLRGEGTAPALAELLGDPSRRVRLAAVLALQELGWEADDAVPALLDALADRDPEIRAAALDALAVIGAEPGEVAEALAAALASPSRSLREEAAVALRDLVRQAPFVLPALVEALYDPSEAVRSAAQRALVAAGTEVAYVLPELVEALGSPSRRVRADAAYLLGRAGRDAEQAVPALLDRVLDDPAREVRDTAVEAVRLILPEAGAELAALLEERDRPPDLLLVTVFWHLGPPVVPVLVTCLQEGGARLRTVAADALGRIGGPAAVEALASAAARDPSPEVRGAALAGLGRMGPAARPAVPSIQKAIEAEKERLRKLARDALDQMLRQGAEQGSGVRGQGSGELQER